MNISDFAEITKAKAGMFNTRNLRCKLSYNLVRFRANLCRPFEVLGQVWAYFLYVRKHKDYDWDYAYLLSLLKWKLERMERCLRKDHILANTGAVCKQINYAIYLLERIQHDTLTEGIHDIHRVRYGNLIFKNGQIVSDKELTEEQKEEESWELMKLMDLEASRRKDAETRLFRHLAKYYNHWWN